MAQVSGAVFQRASQVAPEAPGQVPIAAKLLAELYMSITEAEGLPRYVFEPDILERAYDAATYADGQVNSASASRKRVVELEVESYYTQTLSLMPDVLRWVFSRLARNEL